MLLMLRGRESCATAQTGKARDSGVQTPPLQHMLWWHFHVRTVPGHAKTLLPPQGSINQNLKVTRMQGQAGEQLSEQHGGTLASLGQYQILLPQGYWTRTPVSRLIFSQRLHGE